MTTKRIEKPTATPTAESAQPGKEKLDVGGPVRVARLNSLVAVRAELGRLYREARRKHGRFPDAQTANRLAAILGAVGSSIELVDLEQRLKALEERSANPGNVTPFRRYGN